MNDNRWRFLSEADVQDIGLVMKGLIDGPWLQNRSAFWARLAYPRDEVEPWVRAWPESDIPPIVVRRALGEVLLGIRVSDEQWEKYFQPVSQQRTEELYVLVKRHVDRLGNWIHRPVSP